MCVFGFGDFCVCCGFFVGVADSWRFGCVLMVSCLVLVL